MTPPIDPAVAVRAVLAGPAFRRLSPYSAEPSLFDRAVEAIARVLRPLFEGVARIAGGTRQAQVLLGLILFAATGIVLVYLTLRIVRRMVESGAARGGAGPWSGTEGLAPAPARLWAACEVAAARGAYREALGLLYAWTLARLDVARAVRYDPARTVREYERALAAVAPAAREPYRAIGGAYSRAAFAAETVSAETFEAALRAAQALERAL